tara:strand:- start:235 stop:507 length:273 start_codon:yes stop_codon:yes gene_type:complete
LCWKRRRETLKKKGQKKAKKGDEEEGGQNFFVFFSFLEEEGRKEMFLRLKKEGKERERFDFELRYPLELLLPQSDFQGENFSSTVPARKN